MIPGNGEGSSFIFARRQVESLTRLGIEVSVFHLGSRTDPRLVLNEWIRLRRAIKEFSPEVVHAHYGTMTGLLCSLATLRPVAITFRGSDLNLEPGIGFFRNYFGHLLSQLSALRAGLICCTSAGLKARLWWRKRKVVVVPTGVNLDLFCPMPKDCARRALGWDIKERIVLFNAGRNPVTKGLALARQAVEAAKKSLGFIRLVQLNGEVEPENIPLFLNAADCLVIASVSEGSPNILKEAMACNLPVASVDVGDAAERLKGVFPSSVIPRSCAALAQAIVEILAQPRRSNGREMILECSEANISLRMQEAYAGIAQKQGRIRRVHP